MHHREIISADVGAGEIEVDQSGDPVAEHQDIVRKQIGVDRAARKVGGPCREDRVERAAGAVVQARLDSIQITPATLEQRLPCRNAHRIRPVERKIGDRLVHLAHRLAGRARLHRRRMRDRYARKELDEAGRAALQLMDQFAVAIGHRGRDGQALFREMIEQRHEIGQVAGRDALFVQRQDETAFGGVDEIVRILHAFGDALGGDELAHIELREEVGQGLGRYLRVDCQPNPRSP